MGAVCLKGVGHRSFGTPIPPHERGLPNSKLFTRRPLTQSCLRKPNPNRRLNTEQLPREVDPNVYHMLHEDAGGVSFSSIGGASVGWLGFGWTRRSMGVWKGKTAAINTTSLTPHTHHHHLPIQA